MFRFAIKVEILLIIFSMKDDGKVNAISLIDECIIHVLTAKN